MLLKIVRWDSTMTLPPRNVLTVQLGTNAVYLQKLYVHLEQCMIRILQSALSAQMFTFVFIQQLVLIYPRIAGVMVKTPPCQPSWIFLSMPIDCQPRTINIA